MAFLRDPRRVQGFTDIGPITIPPRPKQPALVDRSDGNTYKLIKSGADPALSLLSDTSGFQVFAAFSGPYIQDGTRSRKLFSTAGVLSSEAVAGVSGQAPVLVTVAASPLDVWQVVWDGDALALTLTELL